MCWLMLKSPKHVCMVGASQHPTAKLRHRNRAVFFRHTWSIWSCPQLGSAEKSRKTKGEGLVAGAALGTHMNSLDLSKYYGTMLENWWWILILPHQYADSFGGFWRCSSIVFQRYLTVTEQNINWLFSAKLQILELGSLENFGGFRFTTHLKKQLSTLDSAEKINTLKFFWSLRIILNFLNTSVEFLPASRLLFSRHLLYCGRARMANITRIHSSCSFCTSGWGPLDFVKCCDSWRYLGMSP